MNTHMYFEELSFKQNLQLLKLCKEFQPYMPFNEVVFLELVSVARIYCDKSNFGYYSEKEFRFQSLLMKDFVTVIKNKYYFNGIKPNGRVLDNNHYRIINNYIPRVKTATLGINDIRTYKPIEKVLFMKLVRACRDFLRTKMSKEAEPVFFEKLNVVYDAMA
nr:MAG TPA: hypothetical protein [Bacteriophage sp.]